MKKVKLREVAHARGGEKGDAVNIAIIVYREEDYHLLEEQVTAETIGAAYGEVSQGDIRRYEIPSIGALNFVLERALGGGRSRTLAFDESSKALSARVLGIEIEVPDDFMTRSEFVRRSTEKGSRVPTRAH
jgi:hypothetical protein